MKKENPNLVSNQVKLAGLFIALAVIVLAVGIAFSNAQVSSTSPNSLTVTRKGEQPEKTDSVDVAKNNNAQNDMLLYLIEEEKLAHDVYTVMYQKYGAKVFGNILKSEETHQGRVLALLQARNISDPRSTELGVFNNPELQKLYKDLIAQGSLSAIEAYKVGVAVEEKDVADITKQLASATDSDIVSTLEALRDGSENHLRAFNRQLGSF